MEKGQENNAQFKMKKCVIIIRKIRGITIKCCLETLSAGVF